MGTQQTEARVGRGTRQIEACVGGGTQQTEARVGCGTEQTESRVGPRVYHCSVQWSVRSLPLMPSRPLCDSVLVLARISAARPGK
jgi:hypothetical protein